MAVMSRHGVCESSPHGYAASSRVRPVPALEWHGRWWVERELPRRPDSRRVQCRLARVRAVQEAHVETAYPAFDEEYFEWVDVLEAVVGADGPFTMIELGAGWGRWLMTARQPLAGRIAGRFDSSASRPSQRTIDTCGSTSRTTTFSPESLTLIEAAVAAQDGRVRFHVGDPTAWYGQAIEHSKAGDLRRATVVGRLRRRRALRRSPEQRGIVDVRAVTLASILRPLDRVDLIDLDVQGVEAEVLEAAEDALARKVLRVHVGTHSEDNGDAYAPSSDGSAG